MTTQLPWPVADARALATLRILVGGVPLLSGDVWRAPLVSPAPWPLVAAALVAAAATCVGLFTRAASIALAACLFAIVDALQRGGTAVHAHHLAWLAAVVASAPSGAAWSIDARRGRAHAATPTDAGVAVLAASLVLAGCYVFPGIHKLFAATSPFFDADALARLVRLKAVEAGRDVPFGLDAHPSLLVAGAAAVVVVELALPFLAVVPRVRIVGAVVMLAFHAALGVVLAIPFTALAVFAPVLALRVHYARAPRPSPPILIVAAVLLGGIAWTGAAATTRAAPFACYPTFASRVPATIGDVVVEVVRADGSVAVVPADDFAPLDMRTAVIGAARRARDADGAVAVLRTRADDRRFRRHLTDVARVRFVVVRRDLAATGMPPIDRRVVADVAVDVVR